MDAESAEHKGALDLRLSILPCVQLTVHTCLLRVGAVQSISITDWKSACGSHLPSYGCI